MASENSQSPTPTENPSRPSSPVMNDRNPSPPPGLLENEDAMADTVPGSVVSRQWALQTLLSAVKDVETTEKREGPLELDEELEVELCKLWDVSVDNKITSYLAEMDAINILVGVISKSLAPRLTEICVGILGNMACNANICETMSSNANLINVVLLLLETLDPPTLVESLRLINTFVCCPNTSSLWIKAIKEKENLLSNIVFILECSTNDSLLKNMAEFLDNLIDLDEELCANWSSRELILGVIEAMHQLRLTHPETRDTYWHVLQLLTRTPSGISALNNQLKSLYKLIQSHLSEILDDDFVLLGGRQCGLASLVSVLQATLSLEGAQHQFQEDPSITRYMLQLLSLIHHDRKEFQEEHEKGSEANDGKPENDMDLTSVLKETLIGFWCDVIDVLSLPLCVLDQLESSCKKDLEALLTELNRLPQDGSDYILTFKQQVEVAGTYNRLHDMLDSLSQESDDTTN